MTSVAFETQRAVPHPGEAFAPHHTIESLTELPAILETEWTR